MGTVDVDAGRVAGAMGAGDRFRVANMQRAMADALGHREPR
jgi:hypothetical protein